MRRLLTAVVAALAAVLVTAACAHSSPVGSIAPASASASPTPEPDLTLHLEQGLSPFSVLSDSDLEVGGTKPAVLDVVHADGGMLRAGLGLVSDGSIRFPRYSEDADGPVAIVKLLPSGEDWMSPHDAAFEFGLDLRVDEDSSGRKGDNGDNALQRGLFTDGAQFKIQADHHHPSCVVRGSAGRVMATLPLELEERTWYRVDCARADDTVTLTVERLDHDGDVDTMRTAVATGEIGSVDFEPDSPLTVGGKLREDGRPAAASDQFNGAVDDVHLTVG